MKGIQEFTKEQLLLRAAPYFKSVNTIIATSDGNFFYADKNSGHYADSHCRSNKLQKYLLSKSEYEQLVKPKKKEVLPQQETAEIKAVDIQEEIKTDPPEIIKDKGKRKNK